KFFVYPEMDISRAELRQFEIAFKILDTSHDGKVTAKELGSFLEALGQDYNEGDMMSIVNELDTEGCGAIEFPNFVRAIAAKMCKVPYESELREVFRIFDKSDVGYINFYSLRTVMFSLHEMLSDEGIVEMIRSADHDGDGVISFEDFVYTMTSN
ncbi:hypothetical protein KR222_004642, partial [Zaprionus bogoriensis]